MAFNKIGASNFGNQHIQPSGGANQPAKASPAPSVAPQESSVKTPSDSIQITGNASLPQASPSPSPQPELAPIDLPEPVKYQPVAGTTGPIAMFGEKEVAKPSISENVVTPAGLNNLKIETLGGVDLASSFQFPAAQESPATSFVGNAPAIGLSSGGDISGYYLSR